MPLIGFSTGALALGDFRKGVDLQRRPGIEAIELSALREDELNPLVEAIPSLPLADFKYVSLHAPSCISTISEAELVDKLTQIAGSIRAIIVHPDVIQNPALWESLQDRLVIENMDQRKPVGRFIDELAPLFGALPQARFCFDIGHARQVDPTMGLAVEMLKQFADRIAEVHISEVNAENRHVPMSTAAVHAFRSVRSLLPSVPYIIESMVSPHEMESELNSVAECLNGSPSGRNGQSHSALSLEPTH